MTELFPLKVYPLRVTTLHTGTQRITTIILESQMKHKVILLKIAGWKEPV